MASSPKSTGKSATTRYQEVAQALMHDLERGKHTVGSMFPTELEICARFGISRHTAREAIRRLTDIGLVSRRAGIGTTVRALSVSSRYTASISDPSELIAFTQQTRFDLIAEDWVDIKGELTHILPSAVGERWLRFTGRRFVAEATLPIAFAQILVHPAFEGIRHKIDKPGAIIYRLIEELDGEPIAELKQEISCVSLSKKVADLLGARAGSPAMRVLRYYIGAHGATQSVAINTYPQDRFKLTTLWKLDWAASES